MLQDGWILLLMLLLLLLACPELECCRRQVVRSSAFLQAEWIYGGLRSIPLNQVLQSFKYVYCIAKALVINITTAEVLRQQTGLDRLR